MELRACFNPHDAEDPLVGHAEEFFLSTLVLIRTKPLYLSCEA